MAASSAASRLAATSSSAAPQKVEKPKTDEEWWEAVRSQASDRKGWLTADRKPVKNADLWVRLDELASKHELSWHWVRGHDGHPENERADSLANRGVQSLSA